MPFSFGEIEPNWERVAPFLEQGFRRVPMAQSVGIKKLFCGPESFTPDGAPLFGETPEVRNYFVAAGLNSIGILTGGGIGRALAHWIVTGRPDVDITAMNVDRFQKFQCTPAYRTARVVETLGDVYSCHYPYKQKQSARGAKRSPFYNQLLQRGACFKDVSGWEGADWYEIDLPPGSLPPEVIRHSFKQNEMMPWFTYWAAEHKACREGVVAIDMSFMSKFLVQVSMSCCNVSLYQCIFVCNSILIHSHQGPDAAAYLNWLSTAQIDSSTGCITYTQWLNEAGTLEADVTVTRLPGHGPVKYIVIATDTAHRHVETILRRQQEYFAIATGLTTSPRISITDVTGGMAQLNIQGPKSRELLKLLVTENGVASADVDDANFSFRDVKELEIGIYGFGSCQDHAHAHAFFASRACDGSGCSHHVCW